jgi:hypothetical protein
MIQSRFESLSNEKVIIEETKEIFRVKVPVIYSK